MQCVTEQFAIECFSATKLFPTANAFCRHGDHCDLAVALFLGSADSSQYSDLLRSSCDQIAAVGGERSEALIRAAYSWLPERYGAEYASGLLWGWYQVRWDASGYAAKSLDPYCCGVVDGVRLRAAVFDHYAKNY